MLNFEILFILLRLMLKKALQNIKLVIYRDFQIGEFRTTIIAKSFWPIPWLGRLGNVAL